jgi:hypothetical protein
MRAGKKTGEGEEERERERERGGGLTSGSKSGDHRLQNLGHHGVERERGGRERERLLLGRNQMRERDQGGARMGKGMGARGAPGRAGPHRGPKPRGTHNHKSKINPRSKIRNGTKQST